MKRLAVSVLILLVFAFAFWLYQKNERERKTGSTPFAPANSEANKVGVVSKSITPQQQAPTQLIGDNILQDYAKASLPPENDLTLMSRLMDNFTLIVKSAADRPLSANEDWAAAFRGFNPSRERFLPDQHSALNARGQLIDRWGTPLFFHALGGRRFDLRSAGPDRALWTSDDIHRNYDGSFRRGTNLNAASLLESAEGRSR